VKVAAGEKQHARNDSALPVKQQQQQLPLRDVAAPQDASHRLVTDSLFTSVYGVKTQNS